MEIPPDSILIPLGYIQSSGISLGKGRLHCYPIPRILQKDHNGWGIPEADVPTSAVDQIGESGLGHLYWFLITSISPPDHL